MWEEDQTDDVQVIEINNQIELLPNDCESKPFLNEELCKDMLSKVKENVNKLHLQTYKNNVNAPEVDVEYKVTNGSLNQRKGNYAIENVEIKKKVKQENDDEIQDSVIKIQNNNMRLIDGDSSSERFDMNNLANDLQRSTQLGSDTFDRPVQILPAYDSSIDIHPNQQPPLAKDQNTLWLKYLEDSAKTVRPEVLKSSKVFKGEKLYPIGSKVRGYCLIINNVDFDKIYQKRRGSDREAEYLTEIFKQLDFEVIYHRNLTSLGMAECFGNIVKRPELRQHDTFVSIILTHGDDSKILIGIDAYRLKIDYILHHFTDANCPNLSGKPKLFFIQACRGNNHDFGTYDQATVSDAAPVKASSSKVRKEVRDLNRLNDLLVVNSTLDGFVSLRNEINGSWFGDALGMALCEHSKDMELHNLLLFVNRKILEREKGDVQQAIECVYHNFKKGFYFNPGHYFDKTSSK